MNCKTSVLSLLGITIVHTAAAAGAQPVARYNIDAQWLSPWGGSEETRCDYTRRPDGSDWYFGPAPEDVLGLEVGGGGRFLVFPGFLKHEQNPEPRSSYPAQPLGKLPTKGYDTVLAVVDVERCRIVRFINYGGDPLNQLYRMAEGEPVLVLLEDKTRVYAGAKFALAGEVPVQITPPVFLPNGYLVGYVLGPPEPSGLYVHHLENEEYVVIGVAGQKVTSWRRVPAPAPDGQYELGGPKAEIVQGGKTTLVPAPIKEGAVTYTRELVFADARWLLLRLKTNIRKDGQTIARTGMIRAYDSVTRKVTSSELPADAQELAVTPLQGGTLEVKYGMGTAQSKLVLGAQTAPQ